MFRGIKRLTFYSRWAEGAIQSDLVLKESFCMWVCVGNGRWQLYHQTWHLQKLGTTWELVTEFL